MNVRTTILWPCPAALLFSACSGMQVPAAGPATLRTLSSQNARLGKAVLILRYK